MVIIAVDKVLELKLKDLGVRAEQRPSARAIA